MELERSDLRAFFEPASVAVVGSLRDGMGLGFRSIKNMLNFGYTGRVYPVNPSYDEVLGFKAYSDVSEIPEDADQVIVITPPPTVPAIVERAAERGVKAAVIVSENFGEVGGEGAQLQRQLVEIRDRTGIRIVGPNTIGLLNTANGYITVPYYIAYDSLRNGAVTYCSQSGFVGPTAQPLQDKAYPINKMCDVGNKCDVNETDLLKYFVGDPSTKVVAMHIEDVKDGRAFLEAARNLVSRKPLLVMKAGRSEEGAKAASSHTSSLAGNEDVCDCALRQAGAIRVNSWPELMEIPKVFAYQPLPEGNRVAIITHTGGAGVVATDVAVEAGLTVARFSEETVSFLKDTQFRLGGNPVDMGPILSTSDNPFQVQEEAIARILNDPNVDCAIIAAYGGLDDLLPLVMEMFGRLKPRISKPFVVWLYGMKLGALQEMVVELEGIRLPAYIDIEVAIKALGAAARYVSIRAGM
jgi:acyl-CoA synthetase (NDP forming)